MFDHKAIGIDGFAVITETALTLTLLVPAVAIPNRLKSGVRNEGVAIALFVACSKATLTPFAVAIGSE
jgi:Na+/melibiose symporter-like transporter